MAPPQGYIDPNFPNPHGSGDAPIIIYGYRPSLVLAAMATILFGVSFMIHVLQLYRYRTYYFSIPVVIGTLMEVVGYIFRILSSVYDPYAVIYFVVQYFFIVVAPVFFSAAIYAILSVFIKVAGRQFSPLFPPKWILIIFITCDVIATGVQIAGAANIGVAESNKANPKTANNILLAGLAFQVFSFFIFLVLLSIFLWRARKVAVASLRSFTFALLTSTLLVYLRTCFRLAETAGGVFSYLSSHEVFFGCLEFMPIVLAVFLLNWWHPGKCLLRS